MKNLKAFVILCMTLFLVCFPQVRARAEGHHQSGIAGLAVWDISAPRPVQCFVSVETGSGELVTTIHTDANGLFRVALKPGSYLLTPFLPPDANGVVISGVPFLVRVEKKDYIAIPLFFTVGPVPF